MTIDLSWYHVGSQEVLHYVFNRNWTWDEMYQIKKRADRMLEASKHAIPVFFDFTRAPRIPSGMINNGRQLVETRHPHGSPMVVVGGGLVMYNTFKIAERMLEDKTLLDDVAFVPSIVEAERYIKHLLHQPI